MQTVAGTKQHIIDLLTKAQELEAGAIFNAVIDVEKMKEFQERARENRRAMVDGLERLIEAKISEEVAKAMRGVKTDAIR